MKDWKDIGLLLCFKWLDVSAYKVFVTVIILLNHADCLTTSKSLVKIV